jgi:hypothetical protein
MIDQWLADPTKLGALGLMAIAIAALMKGWVVTAAHHQQVIDVYKERIILLQQEKDEYKELIVHSVENTDRALKVVQQQKKLP